MADTIKLKSDLTLGHRANLGEEVEQVELPAGEALAVLQEWDDAWLAKSDDGQIFNVKKDLADPS